MNLSTPSPPKKRINFQQIGVLVVLQNYDTLSISQVKNEAMVTLDPTSAYVA